MKIRDLPCLKQQPSRIDFTARLARQTAADGFDLSAEQITESWQQDEHEYTVPAAIEVERLASWYYAQHLSSELVNHMHDEIEQHLFEVTARGHD